MSETIEVIYDGDTDELHKYAKHALGKYRFIGLTNAQNSPVYVQEDEAADKPNGHSSRSIIFRDWENGENWIGTVNSNHLDYSISRFT